MYLISQDFAKLMSIDFFEEFENKELLYGREDLIYNLEK
jgi:hypothetical protein